MQFKNWILKEEQEINQPYYRVVNKAMHGSGGMSPEGSYWTPRWDAVQRMLQSIWLHYFSSRANVTMDDSWETTVYQLDKAIMTDPPEEHKWAFVYSVDAGEQVLVKALEDPKIATDPRTGVEIKNLMPDSNEFSDIVMNLNLKPVVNWEEKGAKAILDGDKTVYIGTDEYNIVLYEKSGWQFNPVMTISSMNQWDSIQNRLKIVDYNSPGMEHLAWAVHDMEAEAARGNPRAAGWKRKDN